MINLQKHLITLFLVFSMFAPGFTGSNTIINLMKITDEKEDFFNPVWSPDGRHLAFTKPGYRGIWVKNLENDELLQISDENGAGFGFSWSHNGREIVSRVSRYENKRRIDEIVIFNPEQNSRRVVSGDETRFRGLPQWSNDDDFIFIPRQRGLAIFDTNAAGFASENPFPDQEMIYLRSGKIVVEKNNRDFRQVFEPLKNKRYINLTVSPDRDKVAFEVMGGNMFVMNTDGSNLIDLGRGYRPKWSSDSESLIYMISEDDGHLFTSSDIYTINIDGSDKSRLTNTDEILEMNPDWSPDGTKIAFDTYIDSAIYIADIEKNSR